MAKGTYIHKMLELYYKGMANGGQSGAMLDYALAYNIDDQECECGHSKEEHSENLDNCIHCDCNQWKPIEFPLPKEFRELVKKRFTEYVWTYQNNDFLVVNPDFVEVGFSEKVYEDDSYLFILEGRIDLIGRLRNCSVFVDHKSQERKRNLYEQRIQFRNYAWATKQLFGVINYIRLTKTVDASTYQRVITTFNTYDIEWWHIELINIFKKVANALDKYELTGEFEHEWSACEGKYGYPCNYTQLCNEHSRITRNALIRQFYEKRKEWRPW